MLGVSLICPDHQINQELAVAAPKVVNLAIAQTLTMCPAFDELLWPIRVRKVDLVLFCVPDFVPTQTLANCIDDLIPGFPVIIVGSSAALDLLQKTHASGTPRAEESALRDQLPVSAKLLMQAEILKGP
jgi:hypothetical protein